MHSLMDNPEYPSVANNDDDAWNQKSRDEHGSLAAATVNVVQNRASFQLGVVAKFACKTKSIKRLKI
jgi:hypothetical protein